MSLRPSAGLQRDTWRKLCGLVVAGQGSKEEILGVSGCLQTHEQARHREAERDQERSFAQQCWKLHTMVPFMPELGVVCFPAE